MNWFKNLNAMSRLMIGCGVLLVLTLGISFLAINDLSKANDRVDSLYHVDLVGTTRADAMTIDVTTIRGDDLDAIYRVADTAAVARSENDELSTMTDLRNNLEEADKLFVTRKGMEQLAIIRKALPDYERAQSELFRALNARNMPAAESAIAAAVRYRAIILGASDVARTLKTEHAEEEFQANNQAYQTARTLMLTATAISLLLGVVLSIVIARGFSVPLGQTVAVLERVAEGDLTVALNIRTRDEVGRMAEALNRAVEKLNGTMQEVVDSAANASSSSQQLAAAAESIAAGAQEQAASLEETSASLEEITAAVRQNAENAVQASQLAASSKESALQGQSVVSGAITAMSEINTASARISEIISTIDEIAFQTNLLAVNAAVEAARAGDEGRGFAVVASEVRSLAQRSALAAKEIKVLIQDSLRKVETGSELVNRSGEMLHSIVGAVKRATDTVGEIAAASAEQSTGIEQVNTAMTQMDQVTQANSAQTEQLSATAQALSEQAAQLMELTGNFTLSQDGRSQQQRLAVQPHNLHPVHSAVAGFLHSAKANLKHIASHRTPADLAGQTAHRASKTVQDVSHAMPDSRSPNGFGAPGTLAAAPSGPGRGNNSFEEF